MATSPWMSNTTRTAFIDAILQRDQRLFAETMSGDLATAFWELIEQAKKQDRKDNIFEAMDAFDEFEYDSNPALVPTVDQQAHPNDLGDYLEERSKEVVEFLDTCARDFSQARGMQWPDWLTSEDIDYSKKGPGAWSRLCFWRLLAGEGQDFEFDDDLEAVVTAPDLGIMYGHFNELCEPFSREWNIVNKRVAMSQPVGTHHSLAPDDFQPSQPGLRARLPLRFSFESGETYVCFNTSVHDSLIKRRFVDKHLKENDRDLTDGTTVWVGDYGVLVSEYVDLNALILAHDNPAEIFRPDGTFMDFGLRAWVVEDDVPGFDALLIGAHHVEQFGCELDMVKKELRVPGLVAEFESVPLANPGAVTNGHG